VNGLGQTVSRTGQDPQPLRSRLRGAERRTAPPQGLLRRPPPDTWSARVNSGDSR